LRRDLIDAEIRAILDMGVELRTGQALGRDFSLGSLRADGFSAVFLGMGAMRARELQIPGIELDGVLNAVDFLLNANLGYEVQLGEDVIVVGGGNVALDAARTALRDIASVDLASDVRGADAATTAALDVARTAKRLGARRVRVVALESRSEMPAHEFEIEEAEVEGIEILGRLGPERIVGDGQVRGLETIQVSSVFDETGRFHPTFVPGTGTVLACDSVILAIGQTPDLSWRQPGDDIEVGPRGTVAIDPESLATNADAVFAGGDLAFGPRNLIDAIGDGRRAAASIHRRITGETPARPSLSGRRMLPIVEVRRGPDAANYTERSRIEVPVEATERRIGSPEIELGFTEEQARHEAGRCLQCFLNIMLDPSLCILCGGCVDVCPEKCIRILPAERIDGLEPEQPSSVLVLQEERCIRCSLCVDRCPTQALSLDGWSEASSAPISLEPVG
jgi:NADPH-dependent glutamate synthase beta subunit-like oxidoreductase/NAD-dependent dihydropyrimidine dehydrogenase PreA subunit